MHLFLDIPFEKMNLDELQQKLEEKGIRTVKQRCKLEAEEVGYFDLPDVKLQVYDSGSSALSITLIIGDKYTGYNYYGSFSIDKTKEWTEYLFKKFVQYYGEPDFAYRSSWYENDKGGMSETGRTIDPKI